MKHNYLGGFIEFKEITDELFDNDSPTANPGIDAQKNITPASKTEPEACGFSLTTVLVVFVAGVVIGFVL